MNPKFETSNSIPMKPLLFILLTCSGLLATAQNNPIFFGGNEDGMAMQMAATPSQNTIFNGGMEDGSAMQYQAQRDNNHLFTGGNEDGYGLSFFTQSDNNNIFGGGIDDGFARLQYSQRDNNSIFAGGIDDGGSVLSISLADNNRIFAGGIDDGSAQFYATGLPSSFPAPFAAELLSFKVIPHQSEVQLLWTTLNESNHDYFMLERSPDLVQIESIIQIPGAGNPDLPQRYEHWDLKPLAGRSYYRLVPVDINGEGQPSNWVEVNFDQLRPSRIQAFPNPTSGIVNIQFDQEIELKAIAPQLFDLHGRRLPVTFQQYSDQMIQVNLAELPHAIYLLKLIDPQTDLPQSFRIQKK